MSSLTVFSPAKLNLFLAVTGRRADGFHELVSLVAPLAWGDTLDVELRPGAERVLECDLPNLPLDGSNLILRAAQAFADRTGWTGGVRFRLRKVIPMGAGLGGGSSNAVAALRALNQLTGETLDAATLVELAAGIGSDCPLFLHDGPVIMRGRGELIEPLPEEVTSRFAERRVLVFKPAFSVNTAWAYRELARAASESDEPVYLPTAQAEKRLSDWLVGPGQPLEGLLFNTLERPAFEKHVALPTLLERLHRTRGWAARMSGSGSACFGLLTEDQDPAVLAADIHEAWGETALVVNTRFATRLALNPS